MLRQPVTTALDHLPVSVVTERPDSSLTMLEVIAGAGEISELAIALG